MSKVDRETEVNRTPDTSSAGYVDRQSGRWYDSRGGSGVAMSGHVCTAGQIHDDRSMECDSTWFGRAGGETS
ncbi:MAG: hypothetical protein Q4C47_05790 [Planctomycetia bacterium]|nr:hypothetical protein [Planctomycetia bacterium]